MSAQLFPVIKSNINKNLFRRIFRKSAEIGACYNCVTTETNFTLLCVHCYRMVAVVLAFSPAHLINTGSWVTWVMGQELSGSLGSWSL